MSAVIKGFELNKFRGGPVKRTTLYITLDMLHKASVVDSTRIRSVSINFSLNLDLKHHSNAKQCTEYISSVVKVSSCSSY